MCAGRIVLSTIPENDSVLKGLLGVTPQKFKPSIPHLVRLLVMLCQIAYHTCSMAIFVAMELLVAKCSWHAYIQKAHF